MSKKENNDKRDKVSGQSQNMDARNMERKFEKQSQHQQTDKDTADKLGTKGEADSSLEKVFRSAYKNRGKKGKGRYFRNDGKGTGGDKEYSFDDQPKISKPKTRKPRKVSRGTKRSGLMSEFGIDEKQDNGTFQVGGNKEDNTMETSKISGRDDASSGYWSFWGGGGSGTSTNSSAELSDSEYYDTTDDSLISSKDMNSMWSESEDPDKKTYAFPAKENDDYYYDDYDELQSTTKKPRKAFPFLRTFG